jgi:hypothetical protein
VTGGLEDAVVDRVDAALLGARGDDEGRLVEPGKRMP